MFKTLNMTCYTVCILYIIAGVALSLAMIWGSLRDEMAWKSFMTVLVFFLASALTLSVNKMIDRPGSPSAS